MKATVAGALALLVMATPAGAKVLGANGDFTYVKKSGVLPNPPFESGEAEVNCPNGTEHTGGGASAIGPPAVTYLATNGATFDDGWIVNGWQDEIDKKKKIIAWGICTSKPAKVSDVGQNFPGAAAPASANGIAECDSGHVVGGGASLSGAPVDWQLNSTFPIVNDDSWRVYAHHRAGGATMFNQVFVVCMEGKAPRYVRDEIITNAEKVTRKATCRDSEAVIGGGAYVTGDTDDAHVVATAPLDTKADKDKVPDNGWKAKFYNDSGINQEFRAHAICR